MMQGVFAKQMRLPEGDVRVICTDVGGSYGIKVHVYPDEMATAVIAKMHGAARSSSSPTGWRASPPTSTPATTASPARMAVDAEGRITAIDIDDLTGIGPYSVYPRTSAVEGNQVVNLIGGPYDFPNYRAKTTVVFQNKTPTCQYRAVGHPDRQRGHGRPGRSRRRSARPRSGRVPPPQPDEGRHLPAHLAGRHEVRGALATRPRSPSCST